MIADLRNSFKAIRNAVLDSPMDWDVRMILADLYEDIGMSVLAKGQRWQVGNKRRPYKSDISAWVWWGDSGVCPSSIGEELFSLLEDGEFSGWDNCCRVYPSMESAELDLAQALKQLR